MPTAEYFYAIQPGQGGLLTVTSRAYGVRAGTAERLRLAQKVNDHPLNRRFWREPTNDFERKHFARGIISFNRVFDCAAVQRFVSARERSCYATIWIPPMIDLVLPRSGTAIAFPPSVVRGYMDRQDPCALLDLCFANALSPLRSTPGHERQVFDAHIHRPFKWICQLIVVLRAPFHRSLWVSTRSSGVAIAENFVLTAAHSLLFWSPGSIPNTAVAAAIVFGRQGPVDPALSPFPENLTSYGAFLVDDEAHFWVPPEWRALMLPEKELPLPATAFDYALVDLRGATRCPSVPSAELGRGFWPGGGRLESVSDRGAFWGTLQHGQQFHVAGYPGDKSCAPFATRGPVKRLWRGEGPEFEGVPPHAWAEYDIAQAPGSSGSPVWRETILGAAHLSLEPEVHRVLIGVHNGMLGDSEVGALLTPFVWRRLRCVMAEREAPRPSMVAKP